MTTKIWFLTGNHGKVAEAQHHLRPLGYEVIQLMPDGVTITEPQADTLREVALSKIEQAKHHLPSEDDLLLVEDAGLFVDALDDFPGVYSSFVLRTLQCSGILRLLNHLISEDPVQSAKVRSARFEAVAALWDGSEVIFGQGVCPGSIAYQVTEGEGFGFDPVFIPSDLDEFGEPLEPGNYGVLSTHGATFGAVGQEIKEAFSHRTRALDDLIRQLKANQGQ